MKKILMLLVAFCLMVPAVDAISSKELEKLRKKELNEKKKEFKKQGRELLGSSRSLEVMLATHYAKLDELGESGQEVSGVATKVKSKNVGRQMAYSNACLSYAQQANGQLKARMVGDVSANAANTDAEMDSFYSAYERHVEKEMNGELKESFCTIRTNPDGTYEIESFCIVNEDAASKARVRAFENAMKESQAAQKHAQSISDFVNERVE
ncbi:MAG: hypothetical protein K2O88_10195 [Paramuribaculum sp.]|nr:hypothetical protein [Paramuribaculum sp.]